jgi:hypothetical protein
LSENFSAEIEFRKIDDLPPLVDLAVHGLDVLLQSLLALVHLVNEVCGEQQLGLRLNE